MSLAMADLTRSTKRAVTRATMTPGALNAGMNQEFVDTRRRLNDISGAINRLSKSVESTRQTWSTVARQQRDFSHQLASSFPQSGAVQQHAAEVEKQLRNIQQDIIRKDAAESPHQQILRVMDQYLEMLQSIKSEYKDVEVSYTEKMRYQKKVDKLENRKNPNRKHSDKLVRNVEKLNSAQNELDTKLSAVMERMRSAFQKHEAILQCAHHAFWMANNTHMDAIEEATKDIRLESVEVHKLLIGLDLTEDKLLEPVPRPNLLKDGQAATPQIESGSEGQPIPAITSGSMTHSTSVKSESESMATNDTARETEDTIIEDEAIALPSPSINVSARVDDINNKIPDVPTQKPTIPTKGKVTPSRTPNAVYPNNFEAEPIAI